MAVEEVPKMYRYICDACGAIHLQKNANGHYTNSTPPHWFMVRIYGYDVHTVERLLCDECSDVVIKFIKEWKGRHIR